MYFPYGGQITMKFKDFGFLISEVCVWKKQPKCGFRAKYYTVYIANHADSSGSARMFSFYVCSKHIVVLVVHVIGCTSSWLDGLYHLWVH